MNEAENDIFRYYPPINGYIGILSIPHSGEIIPEEFNEFITKDMKILSRDVDFRVDALVDIKELTNQGIAVIVSNIHRTCIDLNRSSDKCVLNWKSNSYGEQIVHKEPSKNQEEYFIGKYHAPYFEMLKTMINELHKKTNKKISLIDLHSMPSTPTEYHLKVTPNQDKQRPDFCVSDIEGLSCTKDFIDGTCEKLSTFSSNITQNKPYYGGHITRHINASFERINNIQIEINRAIYMDEELRVLKEDLVKDLKPNLTKAILGVFNSNQ
jgi:N-formylglutamate amidohydrolase